MLLTGWRGLDFKGKGKNKRCMCKAFGCPEYYTTDRQDLQWYLWESTWLALVGLYCKFDRCAVYIVGKSYRREQGYGRKNIGSIKKILGCHGACR